MNSPNIMHRSFALLRMTTIRSPVILSEAKDLRVMFGELMLLIPQHSVKNRFFAFPMGKAF